MEVQFINIKGNSEVKDYHHAIMVWELSEELKLEPKMV